jgi:small G protein signaling modulator 3
MTSSPSIHITTPTHSHPLSVEETSTKRRRSRAADDPDLQPAVSNYFALKAQLERDHEVNSGTHSWDGSVRGQRKAEKQKPMDATSVRKTPSSSSMAVLLDNSTASDPPPLFVVGSSTDSTPWSPRPRKLVVTVTDAETEELGHGSTPLVLATKWHEYSDEAIQSTISNISASKSPSDIPGNPYHTALRVLSSALNNLSKARAELEESRRVLQEKESTRRTKAEKFMRNLQPSDQDIARRVIESIFTDDETEHQVQKQRSFLVSASPVHLS